MKKFLTASVFIALSSVGVFAQEITTARDFFKDLSAKYSEIKDYEADVNITIGKSEMTGRISYKRPEMLRIDFSDPAEQVVLFNGNDLTIYLPGSSATTISSSGSSATTETSSSGAV